MVKENLASKKGYVLEAGDAGHRFKGTKKEAFTHNDLYVTRDIACERYASQNKECHGRKQVSDYVQTNKTITNKDIVIWYSLSLHHIPRGEETPEMDVHNNSFKLIPKNIY